MSLRGVPLFSIYCRILFKKQKKQTLGEFFESNVGSRVRGANLFIHSYVYSLICLVHLFKEGSASTMLIFEGPSIYKTYKHRYKSKTNDSKVLMTA